ncbi:MAG: VOC family protein [Thermoanaerobaculia bacterium]|nr:VOC family protein [Thermoanaerobaculia bacterium]
MPNNVVHFAIHAEDCERAKAFYETVFGWEFEAWGPPGFWRIHTGPGGIFGALQQRTEPVEGRGMIGFECTIAVEDVQATAEAIESAGGRVTVPPFEIENVGTLIMFHDTEDNVVGAMQYVDGIL